LKGAIMYKLIGVNDENKGSVYTILKAISAMSAMGADGQKNLVAAKLLLGEYNVKIILQSSGS